MVAAVMMFGMKIITLNAPCAFRRRCWSVNQLARISAKPICGTKLNSHMMTVFSERPEFGGHQARSR